MATRKAEPAPAPEEPETPETEPEDNEGLKTTIREVVEEVLGGMKPEEKADDKPMTAREEERRANNIVSDIIQGFKDALAETKGEKKEEKSEPEPVPGTSATRWIERKLWGKE